MKQLSTSYLKRYIGGYFKCVFDEDKGEYDLKNPHRHKICNIRWVEAPGYIYHGISLSLEGILYDNHSGWLFGTTEERLELPDNGYGDSIG